jgi:hypothetical protein
VLLVAILMILAAAGAGTVRRATGRGESLLALVALTALLCTMLAFGGLA